MSLLEDMNKDELDAKDDDSPFKPEDTRALNLVCDGDKQRTITTGITSEYKIKVIYDGSKPDKVKLSVNVFTSASLGEHAAEWVIEVHQKGVKNPWEITRTSIMDKEVKLESNEQIDLTLKVTSPKGARYGDTINVALMANLISDPAVNSTIQTATTAKQSVLAIKTQIGHERAVADTLSSRAGDIGVLSILCPAPLRGYVLVEAMNTDRLDEVVRSIKRARGIVQGEMKIEEIEHYLTPKPLVSGIVEGDIVELIAGPFKGEKARVQNIDEPKEEITVELFEALVPIPVTVKGDSVRVLEKEK